MKTKPKDLFQFEWLVDQDGYEIEDMPPGEGHSRPDQIGHLEIRRRGGPLRYYRPSEEDPGIARRFASLSEDTDSVLEFVNRFGLLGLWIHDPTPENEILGQIFREIRKLRLLYSLLDTGDRQFALQHFNKALRPRMTIRIGGGDNRKAYLEVAPLSLNSFMQLQFAEEITNTNLRYVKCEFCPTWFIFRRNKRFCSSACRVSAHRIIGAAE